MGLGDPNGKWSSDSERFDLDWSDDLLYTCDQYALVPQLGRAAIDRIIGVKRWLEY